MTPTVERQFAMIASRFRGKIGVTERKDSMFNCV